MASIGQAIQWMREGEPVSREGWNGPGQFLMLQVPDKNSKMGLPYIYITTVLSDRVPWFASQTDLLADDWYVVQAGTDAVIEPGSIQYVAGEIDYMRQNALGMAIEASKGKAGTDIIAMADLFYAFLKK